MWNLQQYILYSKKKRFISDIIVCIPSAGGGGKCCFLGKVKKRITIGCFKFAEVVYGGVFREISWNNLITDTKLTTAVFSSSWFQKQVSSQAVKIPPPPQSQALSNMMMMTMMMTTMMTMAMMTMAMMTMSKIFTQLSLHLLYIASENSRPSPQSSAHPPLHAMQQSELQQNVMQESTPSTLHNQIAYCNS